MISKLLEIDVALLKKSFPDCDAVSEQVPTVTIVTSNPETVQMPGEVEATVMLRPDDADGATANGVPDHARSVGEVNVMD